MKLTKQAKKFFDIFHIKGFFAFAGFVIGLNRPEQSGRLILEENMDITMHADAGDFRLRAGGVFLRDGKLLVVREENGDCLIPGGRVRLGETAEEAVLREVEEETGIFASIRRPLFLNQGFFTAPDGRRQHELSFFFLMDGAKPWEGETVRHGGGRTYRLMWIPLDELGNVPLRPKFLRRGLRNLPTEFELLQNFD